MCDVIEMMAWLCILSGTALQRCEGLLKQAYKIVNKYQDNKDVIVHCLDIFEVQSLVEKCDKLFSKSVDLNIEGLAADR